MLRIVPLWVTLHRLLIHYWSEENLNRIASKIGKTIYVDRLTVEIGHISYARLLIKVDVTQDLHTEIYLEEEGPVLTQIVEYEWLPIACTNCKNMDHAPGECKKNKEAPELEQERQRQEVSRRRRFIPV